MLEDMITFEMRMDIVIKNMSEEKLIERLKQQDQKAFDEIYRRYYKKLYFIGLKMLHNEFEAKDVVQESFLQMWQSIKQLKNPQYFNLWMNRILMSKVYAIYRNRKEIPFDDANYEVLNQLSESAIDKLPVRKSHHKNDKLILDQLMDKLPFQHRQILILRYFEQMSMEEIAQVLNIPAGTVKSRHAYAKSSLAKLVEHYEKREGVKLDFKAASLDAAITSALVSEFKLFSFGKFAFLHAGSGATAGGFVQGSAMIVAKGAAAALLVSGGSVAAYSAVNEIIHHNDASSIAFHPVMIENKKIDNPQDAYFMLQNWANTEHVMTHKSKKEIKQVLPLYNEIKKHGGTYYQKLKESDWATYFESML